MAKILLVDDDLELSKTLAGWLTSDKHIVDNVHTGMEGWQRASSQKYDLLILDWDLPDVNGIDILKRYRAMGGMTHVLMLTGRSSVDNKAQGLDAGADDYLTKPFHVTELSARVRSLLRRQGSQKPYYQPLGSNNEQILQKADLAGSQLASRYEFLELIGQGGSGLVFKALHPVMEKFVAIKMLKSADSTEETERFKIEAKAISRLDHQGIVRINDFGVTEQGQPYMVMEYVQGKTLSDMLEKLGPPPLATGLNICMQICDGLVHAHEMKILHRDIKPSNIVLKKIQGRPPEAKILDFGLAKLRVATEAPRLELTQRGDILGSPPYMSPEQVRGDVVDERSDIYSFGCLMYEVCSGMAPHLGTNVNQIMAKHLEEVAAPLRKVRPDLNLPEELELAVAKLLAKKPADRFQSMADFRLVLERIIQKL